MSQLRKLTIELRADGRWNLTREMDETGDRFVADDLHDAHEIVMRAFRPDGTPRGRTVLCGTAAEGKART